MLVKKAGDDPGPGQALGGWLYRVAHRVADRGQPAPRPGGAPARGRRDRWLPRRPHPAGPTVLDQLLSALHEEIARLPEKHRLAGRPLRPGGHDPRPGRRRAALERADPPPPAGRGPRPAQGPPGPAAAWRPTTPCSGPSSSARRRAAVPPAWQAATVRAALDIHRSVRRRRVGLGGGPVTHPGGAQDHARPEADDRLGGPPRRRADGVGGLGRPGLAGTMGPGREAGAGRGRARAHPAPQPEADPLDAGRHLPGARPRARPRRQAGRRRRDLRPASHRGPAVDPAGPASQRPGGPRGGERRRRPVPLRPRQGVERLALRRRAGLARGPDRGRGAGAGHGLGRGRLAAQGGRGHAAAGPRRRADPRPGGRSAGPADRRRDGPAPPDRQRSRTGRPRRDARLGRAGRRP